MAGGVRRGLELPSDFAGLGPVAGQDLRPCPKSQIEALKVFLVNLGAWFLECLDVLSTIADTH